MQRKNPADRHAVRGSLVVLAAIALLLTAAVSNRDTARAEDQAAPVEEDVALTVQVPHADLERVRSAVREAGASVLDVGAAPDPTAALWSCWKLFGPSENGRPPARLPRGSVQSCLLLGRTMVVVCRVPASVDAALLCQHVHRHHRFAWPKPESAPFRLQLWLDRVDGGAHEIRCIFEFRRDFVFAPAPKARRASKPGVLVATRLKPTQYITLTKSERGADCHHVEFETGDFSNVLTALSSLLGNGSGPRPSLLECRVAGAAAADGGDATLRARVRVVFHQQAEASSAD